MLGERMRLGPPLVMIALGGMTLALAGAALWRVIDPLTRPDVAAAAGQRTSRRLRELEREKQLVLKAIKEIELDFQMRKIAERDYREMVERYRARALRLITEIEAGDDFRSLIERELAIRLKTTGAGAARVETAAEAPDASPAVASPRAAEPASADLHRCGACQTANDADARFCKGCGAKL